VEVSRSHFSLTWGLFLSSCIHGLPFALVLALTSLSLSLPERKTETLQLELFGMVTGQQVNGQQAIAATEVVEEQPPEEAPEEPPPPEPTQPPEPKSVSRVVTTRARKWSAACPGQRNNRPAQARCSRPSVSVISRLRPCGSIWRN